MGDATAALIIEVAALVLDLVAIVAVAYDTRVDRFVERSSCDALRDSQPTNGSQPSLIATQGDMQNEPESSDDRF